MKRNIMIAGSYPNIITNGGNPRVNKDLTNNIFLKKYVTMFGELLKVKGKLSDIKILYIGGYKKEENISRAKLYISAYNYYLNYLGYESLCKNNLTVIDTNNIDEVKENIEECDLLFLGIGADSKFAKLFFELEKKGIKLNKLINDKNLLVSSICSGSVMSAERIYGGMYDNYYYGKDLYEYPINIQTLNINPITMETDFCPNDASKEKNEIFIENHLKPDSKKCIFFACKPNSFILIGRSKIYSYGEIYLFVDSECIKIEDEFERADITKLVNLVNEYNKIKNRNNIFNNVLLKAIINEVESLKKMKIETDIKLEEKNVINAFYEKEDEINRQNRLQVNEWKKELKIKLEFLFSEENLSNFKNNLKLQEIYKSLDKKIIDDYNIDKSTDYIEELYLKLNLISLIKKSYIDYKGYYSFFKKDLYALLLEYAILNDRLVYYILDTCGSLFSNQELKKILNLIKISNIKRPQKIINSTKKQLKLFRKEIKYERS